MKTGAHFKNFTCKESGEEDIYVLQFHIRKDSMTAENLESMHTLQGSAVDLAVTGLEKARYDEVMSEKEKAKQAQQALDLDTQDEPEDDLDTVESAQAINEPARYTDGEYIYFVEAFELNEVQHYVVRDSVHSGTVIIGKDYTWDTYESAQSALDEWALESGFSLLVDIEAAVESQEEESCEDHVDSPLSLSDPNIIDAEFSEAPPKEIFDTLGAGSRLCVREPNSEEIEIVVVSDPDGEYVEVRGEHSENVYRLDRETINTHATYRMPGGPKPETTASEIPPLSSYVCSGDEIIRLEEKRQKSSAVSPMRVTGRGDDGGVHIEGAGVSFITKECLDEGYRLVLTHESVAVGDVLFNPLNEQLLPHVVEGILEDSLSPDYEDGDAVDGVLLRQGDLSFEIDWTELDGSYRMLKRSAVNE